MSHLKGKSGFGLFWAGLSLVLFALWASDAWAQSGNSGVDQVLGLQPPTQAATQDIEAPADNGRRDGVFSLGVAFGSQASPYGRESAGARLGLSEATWVASYLQVGRNDASRKSAWGAHLEFGVDVSRVDRAHLSIVPIAAFGVSSDQDTNEDQEQWGAALALQLEVFLTRQISTALRVEAGGQFAPSSETRWSTASSEVLFYYHLR
jgi:hypothetical protein